MKTIIHVNQHKIKSTSKNGSKEPVLTIKNYKNNTYAHEAIIYGQDGKEAAREIYSPNYLVAQEYGLKLIIRSHH